MQRLFFYEKGESNMKKSSKKLTVKMMGALGCGLIVGLLVIFLRETLIKGNQAELWNTINNLLFADISAEGNELSLIHI